MRREPLKVQYGAKGFTQVSFIFDYQNFYVHSGVCKRFPCVKQQLLLALQQNDVLLAMFEEVQIFLSILLGAS